MFAPTSNELYTLPLELHKHATSIFLNNFFHCMYASYEKRKIYILQFLKETLSVLSGKCLNY